MKPWLRGASSVVSVTVVALVSMLSSGPISAQPTERRVALVIGNEQYQHVPRLVNPGNDARLIAGTLKDLGFALVGGKAHVDLDKAAFDRAVQDFGKAMQGAGIGLFYYAGHGVQVRGINYLVPVGANPTREADVDFQMVSADVVLRQMEGTGTRLNLLILDACRNNPFSGRGLRVVGGGLAQMQAPEGTLIAYATQPGNVAQDGSDGDSPYTAALASALRTPGLDVFGVFNAAGLAVKKRTGGVQQPWVSSSPIEGQFYFSGASNQTRNVEVQPLPTTASRNDGAAEAVLWNTVKDGKTQDGFQAYLQQYPQGTFAGLAKAKLKELSEPPKWSQPGPLPGEVDYRKLASPAFQRQFVGQTVAFRAVFLSELRELTAYRSMRIPTENRVFLNHRSVDYTATRSPLGSSDSAFPPFVVSVAADQADAIYGLQKGDVILVKGQVEQAHPENALSEPRFPRPLPGLSPPPTISYDFAKIWVRAIEVKKLSGE